jgi:hypothetical protein
VKYVLTERKLNIFLLDNSKYNDLHILTYYEYIYIYS